MYNVDCNECYHLNITEYEQRDKTMSHICELFKKRVIHRANKAHHDSYLYPHNLCNGEHFKSRCHKEIEAKINELIDKAGSIEGIYYCKDYLGNIIK